MPVQQTPPKFFITHSWKEIDFTKRLCDDLRASGLAGFFDAYSIKPGDVVSAEIGRGLEACDIYVPILSHAALKSPWCEEEIHAAITLGKLPGKNGRPRIIPVLVEDCQDEMPIFLRSRLYINFAGRYDEALSELLTKGFGLSPKSPTPPTLSEQPASPKSWPVLPTRQQARPSSVLSAQPALPRPEPTTLTLPTVPRTWIVAGGGIVGVLVVAVLIAWVVGQLVTTTTPTLGIGSTKTSADGATMVYVPAGKFWMGSSDAENQADDERPQHEVDLDDYWIDKFEVTNALYKKCVDAGMCTTPKLFQSDTRSSYYGNSQYDNYPVIAVTWEYATQYCTFAKKQLPTEAQWEKAARGTDKRIYPWGVTFDASKLNSAEGGKGDTTMVGSYSSGASPYGVMDMAGNVFEIVADRYDSNYYKNSPARNPKNETGGSDIVERGGAWSDGEGTVRVADRGKIVYPDGWGTKVGFRCAQ